MGVKTKNRVQSICCVVCCHAYYIVDERNYFPPDDLVIHRCLFRWVRENNSGLARIRTWGNSKGGEKGDTTSDYAAFAFFNRTQHYVPEVLLMIVQLHFSITSDFSVTF